MFHQRPNGLRCSRFASPLSVDRQDLESPLPVAGLDVIGDARTALAVFDAVASMPPSHETLMILLDHDRRGSTIVNIDGTVDNDSVLHVADFVTELAHHVAGIGGVIVASYRPGGCDELDDIDRWLTIDEQLSMVGIELVEWFVIAGSVSCPRALLGDPSRWVGW